MSENSLPNINSTPQCQFFVVRKKRLCRMTVRPGRQYCGEHEPEPRTEEGKDDTRIPCPYDPKHTCYISKLEKHMSICNARQRELPPYIVPNVNAPAEGEVCERLPLSQIPRGLILQVIDKVNLLYEQYIAGNITTAPQLPIHSAVQREFVKSGRGESSRRHMRQASSLLHLAEGAGLVGRSTCYVELGAGKGQLSFYIGNAWCGSNTASNSNVLVIDRAALRHKRDNKLRECVTRIRADLKDLVLGRVGEVGGMDRVVGFAKHLCGVATDYALRCMVSESVIPKTRGIVLATCCHHRCDQAGYVGNTHLQELGISGEELNVMLGIVSWATCGDGLSRERRKLLEDRKSPHGHQDNQKPAEEYFETAKNYRNDINIDNIEASEDLELQNDKNIDNLEASDHLELEKANNERTLDNLETSEHLELEKAKNERTTDNLEDSDHVELQKAKNDKSIEILGANEHLELQKESLDEKEGQKGGNENLVTEYSIENSQDFKEQHHKMEEKHKISTNNQDRKGNTSNKITDKENSITDNSIHNNKDLKIQNHTESKESKLFDQNHNGNITRNEKKDSPERDLLKNNEKLKENPNFLTDKQYRAAVGRRAKAVLDWGRVLYLRERGFDAHLCYYVPDTVSLENVCLIATKHL